ncbi:50S ribosomal protein L9 [Hoeflea poritis]|uniref:Large ribosomal subunit protein bL9 n=1 Tax=Hoeflea poritis TaxID=2993659 RepID=A0ABT4VQF5_9HYPH|nr:50S ribosomal protein L9 [Hoeflea poritis]MDA4846947.1 50S ribosomal protein L9 [Hoeflea poritis]
MDVILLERVAKLGQMGDVVKVRDGFARNYLLPKGKALRANDANKARFENERSQLEARNLERRGEAQQVADKLEGKSFIVVRAAGETGQLYGSVAARDVVTILEEEGFSVGRSQIELRTPIKAIGMHEVIISLHAEVEVAIQLNVARSVDEAERQAKGEDLTSADAIYGTEEAEEEVNAEDLFDEGVEFETEELANEEAAEAEVEAEAEAEAEASEEAEGDTAAEDETKA